MGGGGIMALQQCHVKHIKFCSQGMLGCVCVLGGGGGDHGPTTMSRETH